MCCYVLLNLYYNFLFYGLQGIFLSHSAMKKIISILLFVLFCIQVIPVRQIGYILCSNQLTEEFSDSGDDGHAAKKFESNPKEYFVTGAYSFFSHDQFYWHLKESLPDNHSTEINTPPPDASAV